MTCGELAKMFNEHFSIGCDLEVIEMEGWRREMYGDETGLPWALPSPNIPTVDTCVVFPATVHIEGTELSEGRGTTKPFELNGAPFINPYEWKADLDAYNFPGVIFRPCYLCCRALHGWPRKINARQAVQAAGWVPMIQWVPNLSSIIPNPGDQPVGPKG